MIVQIKKIKSGEFEGQIMLGDSASGKEIGPLTKAQARTLANALIAATDGKA